MAVIKYPKVDRFIERQEVWSKELSALRKIALSCGLDEDLKWGKPCYSYDGNNILILQGFKDECRIMFFKGVLLEDSKKILTSQGENSQFALVVRFTSVKQIKDLETTIKMYIKEAKVVEEAGLKVKLKKPSDHKVPEEFQKALSKNAKLKAAFKALTPGRQRAYLMHFAGAKQSATRESRIEKCTPAILSGKGLNE